MQTLKLGPDIERLPVPGTRVFWQKGTDTLFDKGVIHTWDLLPLDAYRRSDDDYTISIYELGSEFRLYAPDIPTSIDSGSIHTTLEEAMTAGLALAVSWRLA